MQMDGYPSSPSRFVFFFTICVLFYPAFCAKCHGHMNFDLCTSLDTLYQTTSVPPDNAAQSGFLQKLDGLY
jgi:hypothetical protein